MRETNGEIERMPLSDPALLRSEAFIVKQSGMGRDGSRFSIENYTTPKYTGIARL